MMKLDYYDMDVDEMERRLAAKSSGDADQTLDFDANPTERRNHVAVPAMEGETKLSHGEDQHTGGGEKGDTRNRGQGDGGNNDANQRTGGQRTLASIKVFLNDNEHLTKQLATTNAESDDDLTDVELNSSDLSQSSIGSEGSFDALEFVLHKEHHEGEGSEV